MGNFENFIYHFHPLAAMLSILIFNYKFWHSYLRRDYIISHRSRILSRSVDTLLLLSGIILASYRGGSGLIHNFWWFDYKLLLVIIYIILGMFCLGVKAGSKKSLFFYLAAMSAVAGIIYLVKAKPF